MRTLYNDPVYKKHLAKRNNKQIIMLGFSDGTKDGGYLKAIGKSILPKKN
jgi:phosphoenolpyruvate carboxylase